MLSYHGQELEFLTYGNNKKLHKMYMNVRTDGYVQLVLKE